MIQINGNEAMQADGMSIADYLLSEGYVLSQQKRLCRYTDSGRRYYRNRAVYGRRLINIFTTRLNSKLK